MNKWISVKERLPNKNQAVMISDGNQIISPAWIIEEEWCWPTMCFSGFFITHWMPLPELPKE